jgi:opacity protein-like surface antigen
MKLNKAIAGIATLATAGLLSSATAQTLPSRGLYMTADAGACFIQDTDFEGFPGGVPPGGSVSFDTGVRLGISGGYMFNPYVALEGQVGVMEGFLDDVSGADHVDAYMAQIPFMANLRLQWPNRSIITPYVGAGIGGSTVFLSIDDWWQNDVFMEGDDADTVFAWQAFAGLRFVLNETMEIGAEYRYVASEGPAWETEGINTADSEVRFGDLETHNVSLVFQWRF